MKRFKIIKNTFPKFQTCFTRPLSEMEEKFKEVVVTTDNIFPVDKKARLKHEM